MTIAAYRPQKFVREMCVKLRMLTPYLNLFAAIRWQITVFQVSADSSITLRFVFYVIRFCQLIIAFPSKHAIQLIEIKANNNKGG